MRRFIVMFFTALLAVIMFQGGHGTTFAQSCEDVCFAQQNTCMRGCRAISDTARQNSCVRGCLRGGTACARRCRQGLLDQFNGLSLTALAGERKSPRMASRIGEKYLDKIFVQPEIGHGTHLCSADSHCGTGHKCCSGHCKAVATCGR